MITVTRLNGTQVMINALLIETAEATPDTVITLSTGKKIVVKESTTELRGLVQQFLRTIGLTAAAAHKIEQTED
ncbi:flagellar FlbD family protein [Paenibacillus protaetiae]|uniref:Flagellar protein D n=1 Tax=Paenibacillus protaetiae TaxID=2509456 RepID=A0A4P6EY89_9BACL|nr:flagellar FlbD family protein [Paenibacillus protaetiae]QAY65607.1 flagellar protein D [Paenibacillus protaetiae]